MNSLSPIFFYKLNIMNSFSQINLRIRKHSKSSYEFTDFVLVHFCEISVKLRVACTVTSKEVKLLKRPFSLGLNGIVNGSIRISTYPDMWKYAKVKSIFKKGSTADPGNYRPVSLSNLNSKIYEGTVATVTDKHIDTHSLSIQTNGVLKKV